MGRRELTPKPPRTNVLLAAHLAAMAVTATWMLGYGEHDFTLPMITLAAAVLSLLLVDRLDWFRLHRIVANVAMLAAAFASLNSFLDLGSHEQLVAVANLLVYVQIVLLFQRKNVRIYGQLAVFSLLQVVVACLLNDRLEFGLMLLLYLVVGMLAMILFFLERESLRTGAVALRRQQRRAESRQPVGNLLGYPPEVWISVPPAETVRRFRFGRLLGPIAALVFASMLFILLFFYTAPRTDDATWKAGGRTFARVGFSPEVSFRQMGKVLISNERVMRVAFSDAETGKPTTIIGSPYFRGSMLTMYLTAKGNGNWRLDVDGANREGLQLPPATDRTGLLHQDVLLEPTHRAILFSVFPVLALEQSPKELRVHPRTGILYRQDVAELDLNHEFRYRLATTAFRFGAQLRVTPYPYGVETPQDRRRFQWFMRRLAYLDNRRAFPKLMTLANEIVNAEASGGNAYERAKALEWHFLEPDRYTYSLDFDAINRKRRAGVDPIEDFVSNHRTGHCEYFASALALMLRSQGIPARLVVGYHGGDYNYVGNYFDVRQRHAHAWVEAFLRPDEIPDEELPQDLRNAVGGWLRLDPTPAAEEPTESRFSMLDRVSKSFDYARWLWNDYVLQLTSERQQDTPFAMLAPNRTVALTNLVDVAYWRRVYTTVTQWDYSRLWRYPVSWQSGAAVMLLGLIGVLVWRGGVLILPWVPRLSWRGWRVRRRRRQPIAFYLRLEKLLRRAGLTRRPEQTPRELAQLARAALTRNTQAVACAGIPDDVVDAYYRVRFGSYLPDEIELKRIRHELDRLTSAIQCLVVGSRNGS